MKNMIFLTIAAIVMAALYAFTGSKSKPEPNAGEEGIQFHQGTWEEALQLAKKENKLVFLDIYASWCGPCKMLKRNTFSNAEVGHFYNESFVNVAIDGERGEGPALMQKYQVSSFPSLFFLDGDGILVRREIGYRNPDDFLKLGQKTVKK